MSEDNGKTESELLAEFHHTISEQLNSRLSESPKFFGLLVVVATGFGYVLAMPCPADHVGLFLLASILSYIAVLWAIWYLAALGYAFRFLQNIQHCIERKLGWNPTYVPRAEDDRESGTPPWPTKKWTNTYWLLPGIYHAHAAGLGAFLTIICAVFWLHTKAYWPLCWQRGVALTITIIAAFAGLLWLRGINRHYLAKFADRRNPGVQLPTKPEAD